MSQAPSIEISSYLMLVGLNGSGHSELTEKFKRSFTPWEILFSFVYLR
jgi:hypothetical protein